MATLEDRLTLAVWNAATEGRGNVKLVWGTYQGTGECGSAHPNTLTFDGKPLHITIHMLGYDTSAYIMEIALDVARARGTANTNTVPADVIWGENSVSWYAENALSQFSQKGLYLYTALVGM